MFKKDDKLNALAQVPLFQGLSKADLKFLLTEFKEDQFSAQQAIVKEGGTGGKFFVILEGRADVLIGGRKRKTLGPGSYFGEMALLDNQPRSASVVAQTNVKVLELTSWKFMALLEESWPVTKKILIELTRRVRDLDAKAD